MHEKTVLVISLIALTGIFGAFAGAQDPQETFLNAHNAARTEVGVASLTWDDTVAAFAKNYVSQRLADCSMVHSHQQYGENLAMGSGDFTAQAAVDLWVSEKANYDHSSNSCVGGECLHYTQVVWRGSERLGCAREQCADGSWFVSCNYDPPGNVVGQSPY